MNAPPLEMLSDDFIGVYVMNKFAYVKRHQKKLSTLAHSARLAARRSMSSPHNIRSSPMMLGGRSPGMVAFSPPGTRGLGGFSLVEVTNISPNKRASLGGSLGGHGGRRQERLTPDKRRQRSESMNTPGSGSKGPRGSNSNAWRSPPGGDGKRGSDAGKRGSDAGSGRNKDKRRSRTTSEHISVSSPKQPLENVQEEGADKGSRGSTSNGKKQDDNRRRSRISVNPRNSLNPGEQAAERRGSSIASGARFASGPTGAAAAGFGGGRGRGAAAPVSPQTGGIFGAGRGRGKGGPVTI